MKNWWNLKCYNLLLLIFERTLLLSNIMICFIIFNCAIPYKTYLFTNTIKVFSCYIIDKFCSIETLNGSNNFVLCEMWIWLFGVRKRSCIRIKCIVWKVVEPMLVSLSHSRIHWITSNVLEIALNMTNLRMQRDRLFH